MIGYYAHHVGAGHLTRAGLLAGRSADDVVLLTSRAPADRSPFADVVLLPRDDASGSRSALGEVDAHGALHWAPLDEPGYAARARVIAAWVDRARPDVVVVDVSTEVAALVRLLGVPVVVVAQPGERDDDAHELARRMASAIVAPWPASAPVPGWLVPHLDRTTFVGAMSRFAGRPPPGRARTGSVLVLGGGDLDLARDVDGARAATPGWTWATAGVTGDDWCADLWGALGDAEVVVTHAGQNAVADVAAARRPAVVVASERPHAEQRTTASVLAGSGTAVGLQGWPAPHEWPTVLERARALGGERWASWVDPGAADAMLRVVERVARR